jgi:hypothetical protein
MDRFDQGSRYPVFRPPQHPHPVYHSSSNPGSMTNVNGPAIDYHAQALSVVGAHPSTTPPQEAPPYPVMMRPQHMPQPRASMPVEAVMARYGQALPRESIPVVPALPRQENIPHQNARHPNLSHENIRRTSTPHENIRPVNVPQDTAQPIIPPENMRPSNIQFENVKPENPRRESKGHRLTRSNMRRTQSEIPPEARQVQQQFQEQRAHSPQQQMQQPPPTGKRY